jgi:hypothetical protein
MNDMSTVGFYRTDHDPPFYGFYSLSYPVFIAPVTQLA